MKTLNLYEVTFESTVGLGKITWNVAAETPAKAKRQMRGYSTTVKKVTRCKRLGNVNVPSVIPAGL